MSNTVMTPNEYINHHLINFSLPFVKQTKLIDFSFTNLDTIFFTVLIGTLVCFFLWRTAKRSTSGVPSRFQAAVEILFEFVDGSCREMIHNAQSRKALAPLVKCFDVLGANNCLVEAELVKQNARESKLKEYYFNTRSL